MTPELRALIENAKCRPMTPEEVEEQRISFAYGNAGYEDQRVTRDGIIRAAAMLRGEFHTPTDGETR